MNKNVVPQSGLQSIPPYKPGRSIEEIQRQYGIQDVFKLASKEPFSVNLLAQIAGEAALDDFEFLQTSLSLNRAGCQYLYEALDRLDLCYVKTQANFIMVDLGPCASKIIESLLQMGVIIRPCTAYDLPTFARITIGTPQQIERLVKSLGEIIYARK